MTWQTNHLQMQYKLFVLQQIKTPFKDIREENTTKNSESVFKKSNSISTENILCENFDKNKICASLCI